MDTFIFILEMVGVGVGVGIVSAALGIGGGTLMVPVFLTVFGDRMDINTAKGTSLLVITFVALFNAWRMNRGAMRSPNDVIAAIAAGSIVGGFLGGYVTGFMPDLVVTWIFIGLLGFAALRTFVLKQRVVHEEEVRKRRTASVLAGCASGVVGGATGTGGGAILVPVALWAGIVSNERVVALSNAVMVATAAAGTIAHLLGERTSDIAGTIGLVTFPPVPLVIAGALAAVPLGRRINARLTLPRRRVVMGVLLLLITLRLLFRAIG